jgi:hypothetical protein
MMIRRWLRGCLVPSALCLAAVSCTPSVESLTGGLAGSWAPGSKAAEEAPPPPRAPDDLPREDQIRLCVNTARELDNAGNDEDALGQYERVLTLDPSNYTAMRRLCVLYDRQAQWDKAEQMYRKVSKLKPNDADIWSDWGYSFYLRPGPKEVKRKDWPQLAEAETKLRTALRLSPQHARAHSNLGLVLGQMERYDEAFREFQAGQLDEAEAQADAKADRSGPAAANRARLSEAAAHCDMAFVYWTKNRLEDARRECLLARDKDVGCIKAAEMLALLEKPPAARGDRDRQAASRPGARPSRASRMTPEQEEAEHEAARREVAARFGIGAVSPPPPPADKGVSWQSSGPITLPSGAKWMPVHPGQAPTPSKVPDAPPPPAGGSSGTVEGL